MLLTLGLTVFAWIFYRAENIGHALRYIHGIFSSSLFQIPELPELRKDITLFVIVIFFIAVEWYGRESQFAIANIGLKWKRVFRWSFYAFIIFLIVINRGSQQAFIYFQF